MRRASFFVLALVVFGLQVSPAWAAELVVSNNDLSVQVSGPWQETSDAGAQFLFRTPGAGGATVFWPFPMGLQPGQYQVFANWVSGPDRATNATYFVAGHDGTRTVTENQQQNGDDWQSLGTFMFDPGKGQGVTLTDNASGIVVAGSVRFVSTATVDAVTTPTPTPKPAPAQPAAPAPSPTPTPQPAAATSPSADAPWTVSLQAVDLHAGPDAGTDVLANVPQFSYLQVLGYSGDWAYVFNPRARGTAYAPSSLLGPSDPPPAWVTASPPTPAASVEMMGRTVGKAPLAYYPVDDKFAYTASLGHNVAIMVHDRVTAPDGTTWYRVDGGYLAADSVRLPRPPTQTYAGRWIDADLQEPAMVTAYDGDKIVLDTLAIKGTIANQTPTGTFTILRRVQDETMDSGTLGIDPHGPGGYHLEHVLNTQYFTNDGASLHYNYWSSNFGYSGSHGCLGLDLADSAFFWDWADIGTRVVIRAS
jgi:lipoprotein-anchoring transpeptidase ErfK/SrfK